jgi:hypothetical protein
MTTRSYAELPDEYFERYVETYRELCSKTIRVWGSLFVGLFGQGFALSSLFDALTDRALMWPVTVVIFLPVVIYMFLVFIRVPPPITPRAYRQLLLLVICWFSTNTAVSFVTTLVWSRTARGGSVTLVVVWACILVGVTAMVTLAKYYNKFRNQEIQYRDVSTREPGA